MSTSVSEAASRDRPITSVHWTSWLNWRRVPLSNVWTFHFIGERLQDGLSDRFFPRETSLLNWNIVVDETRFQPPTYCYSFLFFTGNFIIEVVQGVHSRYLFLFNKYWIQNVDALLDIGYNKHQTVLKFQCNNTLVLQVFEFNIPT